VNNEGNEQFVELYSSRTERPDQLAHAHEPLLRRRTGSCAWDRSDYSLLSLSCTVPAIFSTVFGSSVVP
jgi:hypothetical protein